MGAWALAIGASIGWGSLVVTGTSFLGQGSLAGSLIGLGIGIGFMLVIAWNYSYMMRLYPDAGGIYSYVKVAFGYDRAFLSSWFLVITYLAILWANATSLPLFANRFFGDVFRFGYLYTVFGYDVYAGEVIITIAVLFIAGFFCARGKRAAAKIMIVLCFLFVMTVSAIVPFVGRSAIGWIVDVTTIGAVIIYGFVSAATMKTAMKRDEGVGRVTGVIGLGMTVVLGLAILLPTVIGTNVMASESYLLFVVWSIIGFAYFRFYILAHDEQRRFGNYAIVWVTLTALVLVMSVLWTSQLEQQATDAVLDEIRTYVVEGAESSDAQVNGEEFIDQRLERLSQANRFDTLAVVVLFGFSLAIMLSNFTYVRKCEEESRRQLGEVQSVAYTDSLTGVKSKHAFVDWEQRMDERIGEREIGLEFAIVVFDVNGLKEINDTQGHKAGDAYIKSACVLICEHFKHSPVFRVGGDEFVAAMEGADYLNRAHLIEEFRAKVEASLAAGEVVVSEGIAEYQEGSDKRVQLVFERADALMYERKVQLKAMGANVRL